MPDLIITDHKSHLVPEKVIFQNCTISRQKTKELLIETIWTLSMTIQINSLRINKIKAKRKKTEKADIKVSQQLRDSIKLAQK